MKYATKVSELQNVFNSRELIGDELDKYYYDGTMLARSGIRGISVIDQLHEACKQPETNSTYLLLGHRGCGKSTELNKMSEKLRDEGYMVWTVQCNENLDFGNPLYQDILVLMCDALLQMAKECGCKIPDKVRKTVATFWADANSTVTRGYEEESEIASNLEAKAPMVGIPIIGDLLALGVSVKNAIRYREDTVNVYRSRISRRISEWIDTINKISESITEKNSGKRPIVIFEDLDKLDQMNAEHVFFERTSSLTGYNFPVIYTFPIALSYNGRFNDLRQQFTDVFRFPMIKIETEQGDIYPEGYKTIRSIVEKRAALDLFAGSECFDGEHFDAGSHCEESALYKMIEKTGGSLRNLFEVIRDASVLARVSGNPSVSLSDVEYGLTKLQSSLTITIEEKNYPLLASICMGKKRGIEEREMLLEMMQAGVVLEYNGRQWHNVHPLIKDFLEEIGFMQ